MSWQLRYLLPWDALDRDRIRAAVEHVMQSGAGLDLTRVEIDDKGPDLVSVFFYFPAGLERRYTMYPPGVERDFRDHDIKDADEEFVHIDFEHIPAGNPYDLPEQTSFEFYSNISGNRVFAGVGMEVCERLGRYFGVKCEPD